VIRVTYRSSDRSQWAEIVPLTRENISGEDDLLFKLG